MKQLLLVLILLPQFLWAEDSPQSRWGFMGHQRINRLAIFTLPPEMIAFYKKNIRFIVEHSVAPDQRRYAVVGEAPKHFIDLDIYGDSATYKLPFYWKDAVEKFSEDSLMKHGIVPWHIQSMKFQLTKAFQEKDAYRILKISAEMGHYIADANVPLHTSSNYNGQKTNQLGIHAFWESRLVELFSGNYNFFVGQAEYLSKPTLRIWENVRKANACLDSVLVFEQTLNKNSNPNLKYSIIERNGQNVKDFSKDYSRKYHLMLSNQVERQMCSAIKMTGDFWLTSWIDAGQPDLKEIINWKISEKQAKEDTQAWTDWLENNVPARAEN
jgi:hypothetical protein